MTKISKRSLWVAVSLMAALAASSVNAATYIGSFDEDVRYSFVRDGALPNSPDDPADRLRFDPTEQLIFDITGSIMTASNQTFSLASDSGATATFVLNSLFIDLSGPNGMAGGSLDYTLDGVAGTFLFDENIYSGSVFNTSVISGNSAAVYLWGGDTGNDMGIDAAIIGTKVIPVPAAVWLFGSALIGLGAVRVPRKRSA